MVTKVAAKVGTPDDTAINNRKHNTQELFMSFAFPTFAEPNSMSKSAIFNPSTTSDLSHITPRYSNLTFLLKDLDHSHRSSLVVKPRDKLVLHSQCSLTKMFLNEQISALNFVYKTYTSPSNI